METGQVNSWFRHHGNQPGNKIQWLKYDVGGARMKEMQQGRLDHGGVYYRWANEIPLILIIVILVMVVVKPQIIW
jgi:hypothetical protein